MKKKIIAISFLILMLTIGLPNIHAEETTKGLLFDKLSMAHVSIQGSGNEFMIRDNFKMGFGRCLFMRVALQEDGQIRLNKFLNTSDVIDLDGRHVIYLIGFVGLYSHIIKININGVAAQVIWK